MTKKKLGLLCMALVLALGALGVGYAAWTDTIFINGTVNTGTLDIDAEYFSGTDIYKNLDDDSTVVVFWLRDAAGTLKWSSGSAPTNNYLVASAKAEPTMDNDVVVDDSVTVTFTDAYPSEDLCADVIVHCVGSVPVKVDATFETSDQKLQWLYDNGFITYKAKWVYITDDGSFTYSQGEDITVLPVQMHQCEYIKVWLYLDLPQEDDALLDNSGYDAEDFMNITAAEFTAHFYAIQWNEYSSEWWTS